MKSGNRRRVLKFGGEDGWMLDPSKPTTFIIYYLLTNSMEIKYLNYSLFIRYHLFLIPELFSF